MSIRKENNGTWTVTIKKRDGTWRKKRGFDTKRSARKWEVEELERIEHEQSSLPTFRKVAELRHEHEQLEDTTIDVAENAYAHFPYMDKPIDEITKEMLVQWRSDLNSKNLATSSKNSYEQKVKAVFAFASRIYDIKNPAFVLKNFKQTVEEKNSEMQTWTVEEFNQFIKYVPNGLYRIYFEFLFWTGCRRSEAACVHKDWITADGKVTFYRSLRISDRKEHATKNGKVRTIQLDPVLFEHIKPLLDLPGIYLFGGDTPIQRSTADNYKARAIKMANVKHIRTHDFRHSHVSILLDNGISTKAIAERIGDEEQTVLHTYAHLMKKQEDKMNAVIANLHKS